MSVEVFRFGKLIATSKRLGSSDLYHVRLTGLSDEFETSVEAADHLDAVRHVIDELTFAAHHPHKFFNRRKLAAQQSGARGHDLERMIVVANEAVAYAVRMKEHLIKAVYAFEECTFRKLGG